MKITQSQIKQIVETLLKEEGGLGGMATGLNAAHGAFGGKREDDRPGQEKKEEPLSSDVRRLDQFLGTMINTKKEYKDVVDDLLKFMVDPGESKASLADMDTAIKKFFGKDGSKAIGIFRREASDLAAAEDSIQTAILPRVELPDTKTMPKVKSVRPQSRLQRLGGSVRKALSKIPGLRSRLRITSDGKIHISQDLLSEVVKESLKEMRLLKEEVTPINPNKEGADVARFKQEMQRLLDQRAEYIQAIPKFLRFILRPEENGATFNDMIAGTKQAFGENAGPAVDLFNTWYKILQKSQDVSLKAGSMSGEEDRFKGTPFDATFDTGGIRNPRKKPPTGGRPRSDAEMAYDSGGLGAAYGQDGELALLQRLRNQG